PMAGRAAPAPTQNSVNLPGQGMAGLFAHGRKVRHQPDVPENPGDGGVGRNREDVPDQRAAELGPHAHAAGVGEHPISQPGAAHVQQREHAGAGYGKQRHGFGETVDGIAPGLLQQQQNGRDQRAGVTDTDPPDEVDDGEAPAYGDVDTPDADANQEQVSNRRHQNRHQAHADGQARQPAQAYRPGQHGIGNRIGHRTEGLPGP